MNKYSTKLTDFTIRENCLLIRMAVLLAFCFGVGFYSLGKEFRHAIDSTNVVLLMLLLIWFLATEVLVYSYVSKRGVKK